MFKAISKLLISIIFTLSILILFKKDINFKEKFYENVYKDNISFAYLNNLYNKYLGDILNINEVKVFGEKLNYSKITPYLDGVLLTLDDYIVTNIEEGIVTYIGRDDNYNNYITVEDINGIKITYGNLDNINVSIYDYLDKNSLIGNSEILYLSFTRDGNVLNYEEYIK